ncbi:MAG TPA: HNH endonuclease [Candidatus Nanoarchaeia archaeon]|nr:HNH endonuclease [Candidatus Nanoarchaeia archaeon]
MAEEIPPDVLKNLKSVTAKRARTVIDHIIKHGHITTEELEKKYGYAHPPRAARDVREQGIPLKTVRVKGSDGRTIAAYAFDDLSNIDQDKLEGRKVFSKQFKEELLHNSDCKCYICMEKYDERYLQIDHRVPYEVEGDIDYENRDINDYMLVCGSCNRAKSWSCEHCENWSGKKDITICKSCYWSFPENYSHLAGKQTRRLDLVWADEETKDFDALVKESKEQSKALPDYVKDVLKKHSKNKQGN